MSYSAHRIHRDRYESPLSIKAEIESYGVIIERGIVTELDRELPQENALTCYAAAHCLSMHSLHQTYDEARAQASTYEGIQTGSDHTEYGYVLPIEPGELRLEENRGLVYDCHNGFNVPDWMILRPVVA